MVHPAAGQFRAQGPMPSGPYYGAPNGAAQSQFPQSPTPNSPYFGPPPQGPPPTGDAPKAGGSRKRTVIAAAAAMALLAGGGAAAYFSLTAPAPGYQPLSYAGPVPFTAPVGADNPAIDDDDVVKEHIAARVQLWRMLSIKHGAAIRIAHNVFIIIGQ